MCRAETVLCVAPDREQLVALKHAVVAAEWELTAGATDLHHDGIAGRGGTGTEPGQRGRVVIFLCPP